MTTSRLSAPSVRSRVALALALAGLPLTAAFAADYNFALTTGTGLAWNNEAIWTTLPVDDATFPNAAGDFANAVANFTTNSSISLNQAITIGRLDIGDNSGGETLTLQSGTGTQILTFDATSGNAQLNVASAGTGAITISNPIALADNLEINKGSHQININGAVNLGANTLTINGTATGVVQFGSNGSTNGLISGAGSVVVNAVGTSNTVTLFGPSTYTGGTTINNSQFVVGTSSVGPANAPTSGTFGTGLVTINGGLLRATSSGSRTVANTLVLGGNFALSDGTNTTSLTFTGDATITGGTRTITVGAGSGTANANTFSGAIGDGGNGFGLTKAGGGALQLSGANTYSGTTTVEAGTLLVGANVTPGVAGPLGNATSAVIVGTAASSASLLTSAAVTVARDITIGGTGGTQTLGGSTDVNSAFTGAITLNRSVTLSSVATGANATVFNGQISGGFAVTKAGTGIVTLANTSNNFTGGVAINNGTLRLAALGTEGAGGVTFTNTTGTNAATLQLGDAFTFAKNLTIVAGSSGATTLSASNAAGTTAIYSGTIALNKTGTVANATAGATTRFTGVLSGVGGVIVNGAGTVDFAGAAANTYTGLTTVSAGTLLLNSAIPGGAIIGDGNTATADVLINGGTLLFGASDQLGANTTIQFSSGALDLAGKSQTIFDLDYTGGAILNASGLTITNGTDEFLFDGTTLATNRTLGRKLIYAGSTLGAVVSGHLALDADAAHEFAINDGAAAIDTEISGVISNETTVSTIVKRGGGTLRLSSATGNAFGGAGQTVTIEGGILAVTADNQLGDAANSVTFTGGALRFDGAGTTARPLNLTASGGGINVATGDTKTLSLAGQLIGSAGVFVKSGAGTLILSADQSATWTGGSTTLADGTLSISAENQLGALTNDVTLQGGTLQVTTGFVADAGKVFTLGAGGGGINVAAGQTLGLDAAGQIVGNTVFTKSGAGTLRVGAANAGLTAGAGVNISAGAVELRDAGSLGTTTKAAVTLSGGALVLRNDAATAFANPVTVTANSSVVSDVVTVGAAGVTQTLGALSLGNGASLTAEAGPNVTGGAPVVAFSGTTLTGSATLATTAPLQLNTGGIALGANKLTLAGNGAISLNGVISGGPGAGQLAIEKNGVGTAISSTSTSTFSGDVAINAGVYRLAGAGALGTATNVIKLNGGALDVSSGAPAYALQFNGGALTVSGADRTWNGQTSATPSIFFNADTTFNLTDSLVPTTDRFIDLGATAGGTGVPTSSGPVNITVNANATNITSLKKLRFNNVTDSGSVTGTLTINANAIGQIRSGGGAQNALGSGVLLKLNTGVNLADTDNSGRLEVISDSDANFGNDVQLLGDSTINPQRIATTQTTPRTMTLNDLSIGEHVLVVDDAGGNNYSLVFDGVTTLTGNSTFHTVNALTLASITDGPGSFGITKAGNSTLTLTAGSYEGATVVNAGTLALGSAGLLNPTAPLTVNGGTLNLNTFNQAAGPTTLGGTGNVTVNGTATLVAASLTAQPITGQTVVVNAVLGGSNGFTKNGAGGTTLSSANVYTGTTSVTAGTLTANAIGAIPGLIDITGGQVTQGIANAFTPANDVTVNGGRLDFLGKSGSLHNVTLNGPGNVNALGLTTGTNAASIVVAEITGTLTVNGDASSVGTSVTVNSGGMGANLIAEKLVIQSGTTVSGSGAIFVGGNAPGSSLTIGAGGLEISNIAAGAYNAIYVASSGGASRLNLGGNVTFTGNDNPSTVRITGVATGSGGVLDLGTAVREFNVGDGAADVDLFVGLSMGGSGGITKKGAGTLEIGTTSNPHTYFGATTVDAGTLVVSGNISSSVTTVNEPGTLNMNFGGLAGPVTLQGGKLGGNGGVMGALTAVSGIIAPAQGPGTLDTGDFVFSPDATLQMEIGGFIAGFEHDQVRVVGELIIGGQLSPSVINGFVPLENDMFFLMLNDGVDSVVGTFAGLDEGSQLNFGGSAWTITYAANGDFGPFANDIALIAVPEPASAFLLLGGLGALASARRRRVR